MHDVPTYGTFDQNVRKALAMVGKPSSTFFLHQAPGTCQLLVDTQANPNLMKGFPLLVELSSSRNRPTLNSILRHREDNTALASYSIQILPGCLIRFPTRFRHISSRYAWRCTGGRNVAATKEVMLLIWRQALVEEMPCWF